MGAFRWLFHCSLCTLSTCCSSPALWTLANLVRANPRSVHFLRYVSTLLTSLKNFPGSEKCRDTITPTTQGCLILNRRAERILTIHLCPWRNLVILLSFNQVLMGNHLQWHKCRLTKCQCQLEEERDLTNQNDTCFMDAGVPHVSRCWPYRASYVLRIGKNVQLASCNKHASLLTPIASQLIDSRV